ncbi:MAG TPA: N-acetylneuraminate synthase family protein [Candidatus Acidoferrales bacterium]|nr:N-acetylneuraminate synthase family protein [Candidatus Acidoferrales bacterium]
MPSFKIGNRLVGSGCPTYFIADIAANHDGLLDRALALIRLAKQAGADAAKFQHFRAAKIVSDYGFQKLRQQRSHQASWNKSVYEVYEGASLPWEWTPDLKACCDEEEIEFLSTPYDSEAVNMLDPYVEAFKIGSGDITWLEMLEHVAAKKKPVILSTGSSDMLDVQRAVQTLLPINPQVALLQCNTNYMGNPEGFTHVHLNVLRAYQDSFPEAITGLSDHTRGHAAVLGAVALGARIIEKHFTDDISRDGPDHHFSMTPASWCEMVERTRELERALGSSEKRVAENEEDTVVIQRRCLRATRNISAGTKLCRCDIDALRPAPSGAIFPFEIQQVIGRRTSAAITKGQEFTWSGLE